MTAEQMKELAKKIAAHLNTHPDFSAASFIEEDFVPGEALSIGFLADDGDGDEMDFVLDLNVM